MIFDQNNPSTNAPTNNAADRPSAKIWLNIGIPVMVPNAETGEEVEEFISLPIGLPIDTMKEAVATPNSTPEWKMTVQARNALLESLQASGDAMDAGEAVNVDKFQLRLQKVKDPTAEPKAGENALLAQIADVLGS